MPTESSSAPPSGPKGLAALRTALGVILCLAALSVMWISRSATLGFSPLTSIGIFAIFLPFILLVWPTISFRKNPIKALLPAALAVALVLLLQLLLGTSKSEVLFSNGISGPALRDPSLLTDLLFYAAIGIATYLVFFIPPGKQRRRVIINSILTIAVVEGLFLGEEALFYRDRDKFDKVVQSTLGKSGFVPTEGYLRVAKVTPSEIARAEYAAAYDRKSYAYHWRRVLNPGYTISHSSDPLRVWITREAVR